MKRKRKEVRTSRETVRIGGGAGISLFSSELQCPPRQPQLQPLPACCLAFISGMQSLDLIRLLLHRGDEGRRGMTSLHLAGPWEAHAPVLASQDYKCKLNTHLEDNN